MQNDSNSELIVHSIMLAGSDRILQVISKRRYNTAA